MTIEQRKLANDGAGYWFEYVRINGYSKNPTENGLAKLSRILDLDKKYLKEPIYLYLFGEYHKWVELKVKNGEQKNAPH